MHVNPDVAQRLHGRVEFLSRPQSQRIRIAIGVTLECIVCRRFRIGIKPTGTNHHTELVLCACA